MSLKPAPERLLQGYKPAFTLAEVLITLGIIGVVAAMTIPNLITSIQAHKLRAQFTKTHSTLAQALRSMQANDLPAEQSAYSYPNDRNLHENLMSQLHVATFCGMGTSIDSDNASCPKIQGGKLPEYKSFDGSEGVSTAYVGAGCTGNETCASFILQDGTLIFVQNDFWARHLYISADINGLRGKPNRYGYDLFTFELKGEELLAMGNNRSSYPGWADHTQLCRWTAKMASNGHSCAQKALEDPKYFDKVLRGKWK